MNIDLTATIRGLLFRHDCVIIPGFGGFICNYVPAYIDKSSGMFYPPARRVSFNRNLTHNDGLLVGSVSSEHGAHYGEARDMVEQYAADLRKKLSRGEQVELDIIGVFRTNQEGGIQFEPDATANYNLGSYGLEPFRYEPVAGYDVRKRVMKVRQHTSHSGMTARKLLIRAAVAVPVLIALLVIPLKTDILGTRLQRTSLNPLAKAELEHNREAIDVEPEIISAEVAALPVAAVNTEPSYFLIAGSFKSVENARIMASRLRDLGYSPELMEAPQGFVRVAAKGFTDLEAANVEKVKLSTNVEELWILRRR